MKIRDCAFVAYASKNLARSRAFYEGAIGLTPYLIHVGSDKFWIEYQVGQTTLGLGNEPFLHSGGEGPHLVIEVDDFDDAVAHLRGRGVPFALEPTAGPTCRFAILIDPDGNKLGIHCRNG